MNSALAGIPQHGNVLGNPNAPITITEYGDLVCSTCAAFATTTEPQIIAALVKTGKAKFVYRAFDTASSYANQSQFVNTQVAARSAGLQNKEWNYVLLTYEEQPATIGGKAAEDVAYVNTSYLQNLASVADQGPQPPPVAGEPRPTTPLINEVKADLNSGDRRARRTRAVR